MVTSQCSVCTKQFVLQYAYQMISTNSIMKERYYCSMDCRKSDLGHAGFSTKRTRRIAILNQKGGTGKTTTAINIAAGLADRGYETLLIDADSQGNVGISLGIYGEKMLYHVLVGDALADEAAIPIRNHLDVITTNASLAVAEVWLAQQTTDRDKILAKRLGSVHKNYQFVIIDCGPSLSLLNQNVLAYVDEVIVPVSCDYLSLVGVKQVLKTLKDVETHLGHHVELLGVIPTFYDSRIKLAKESVEILKNHFRSKVFEPIRRSTRLAEAPSHRKTIFEYDPQSAGADDYKRIVEQILLKEYSQKSQVPISEQQAVV